MDLITHAYDYSAENARQLPDFIMPYGSGAIIKTDAWSYALPIRRVEDGQLVITGYHQLTFCKGSTSDDRITRLDGIFAEDIIKVAIDRLTSVNQGVLENDYTSRAIGKLSEALAELKARADARKNAGVQGTYQPVPPPTSKE